MGCTSFETAALRSSLFLANTCVTLGPERNRGGGGGAAAAAASAAVCLPGR
jgi:hypothetical protein